MTRLAAPGRRCRTRIRAGFTLIELLVVLLIIGILIGLLVPAVAAAVRRARAAAVQAEINQLAQALADFKNKFGAYPPSRIVLREDGGVPISPISPNQNGGVTVDVTTTQLWLRTTVAFRKFWPRVLLPNPSNSQANGFYDFDGNGAMSSNQIVLQGQECLVFFLGGIVQPSYDASGNLLGLGMSGFGKSPTDPFTNNIIGQTMYNANRNPPLFEFNNSRLRLNPPTSVTCPGMPYYLDSINSNANQSANGTFNANGFYAYFSTNNGSGYDPNDVNTMEMDSMGNGPGLTLQYWSSTAGGVTQSLSPNPYTASYTVGVGNSALNLQYLTPQSFQILSSGNDGIFGVGGLYNASSTSGSALGDESAFASTNDRSIERDNLTNFRNGTLE